MINAAPGPATSTGGGMVTGAAAPTVGGDGYAG